MDNNFYMQVCYIILYVSQLVLKVIVCMYSNLLSLLIHQKCKKFQ